MESLSILLNCGALWRRLFCVKAHISLYVPIRAHAPAICAYTFGEGDESDLYGPVRSALKKRKKLRGGLEAFPGI